MLRGHIVATDITDVLLWEVRTKRHCGQAALTLQHSPSSIQFIVADSNACNISPRQIHRLQHSPKGVIDMDRDYLLGEGLCFSFLQFALPYAFGEATI